MITELPAHAGLPAHRASRPHFDATWRSIVSREQQALPHGDLLYPFASHVRECHYKHSVVGHGLLPRPAQLTQIPCYPFSTALRPASRWRCGRRSRRSKSWRVNLAPTRSGRRRGVASAAHSPDASLRKAFRSWEVAALPGRNMPSYSAMEMYADADPSRIITRL